MNKAENVVIDKLIGFLQSLKKEEPQPYKVILNHGLVRVTAKIDRAHKRISIYHTPGQTIVDLMHRKADTIESMARCMLQAVDLLK